MIASQPGVDALSSRFGERVSLGLGPLVGARLLVVGRDDALLQDLRRAVGAGGEICVIAPNIPSGTWEEVNGWGTVVSYPSLTSAPIHPESVDGAVWVASLARIEEPDVVAGFREVYALLRTKGKLILIQPTHPKNPMARWVTWPYHAWAGSRYTSRQLHGMLERASFWECGILEKVGVTNVVLMQGEKFSNRDQPDEIWTESQILRAIRVVAPGAGR